MAELLSRIGSSELMEWSAFFRLEAEAEKAAIERAREEAEEGR